MKDDTDKSDEYDPQNVGVTLTPALTALVTPAAEYVGQELKQRLAEKLEQVTERRRQANLTSHIREVTGGAKVDDEVVRGRGQLHLFEVWADGAQDVSPEEETLSSMWQTLLRKILAGIDLEGDLMDALAELSESDASLLLKFARYSQYRAKNGKEKFRLAQIQFSELIEESKIRIACNVSVAVVLAVSLFSYYYYLLKDINVAKDKFVFSQAILDVVLSFFPITVLGLTRGGIAWLAVWRFTPSHQLTWFGRELVKQANVTEREVEVVENRT